MATESSAKKDDRAAPLRLAAALGGGLTLMLVGCQGALHGPPPENADRYRGTMETVCSPVDAQGVGFELHPDSGDELPRVSIVLWPDRAPGAGQRLRLQLQGDGHAAAHVGGTEWTQATDGEIGLESFVDGQFAAGWFSLELSDGAQLRGWFEVDWLDRGPVYCG